MANLEHVKPGDELVLLNRYGGQHNNTDEPRFVRVHKVGPTNIHVLCQEGKPEFGTDTYRRSDGIQNDAHLHMFLTTREEFEEVRRCSALASSLKERRVTVDVRDFDSATLQRLLDALEGKTYEQGVADGRNEAAAEGCCLERSVCACGDTD